MKAPSRIGIIGFGFVGKALKDGIQEDVESFVVDPKLNTSIKDLKEFDPSLTFICVPTPMQDDFSQDISIIENVFTELAEYDLNSIIVLKSTVLPENIQFLESKYCDFIYNPEFLRERHAVEDFINAKLIIFGGKNERHKDELANFYEHKTKCTCKDYIYTDALTAALVKYTINSFLATKVTFFNEIKQVFLNLDVEDSWENFIEYIAKDNRIGDSHMSVPGPDGKEGFGGACLPKDSSALVASASENGLQLAVLQKVIEVNNRIRGKYNIDEREQSQNIRFKK